MLLGKLLLNYCKSLIGSPEIIVIVSYMELPTLTVTTPEESKEAVIPASGVPYHNIFPSPLIRSTPNNIGPFTFPKIRIVCLADVEPYSRVGSLTVKLFLDDIYLVKVYI